MYVTLHFFINTKTVVQFNIEVNAIVVITLR